MQQKRQVLNRRKCLLLTGHGSKLVACLEACTGRVIRWDWAALPLLLLACAQQRALQYCCVEWGGAWGGEVHRWPLRAT